MIWSKRIFFICFFLLTSSVTFYRHIIHLSIFCQKEMLAIQREDRGDIRLFSSLTHLDSSTNYKRRKSFISISNNRRLNSCRTTIPLIITNRPPAPAYWIYFGVRCSNFTFMVEIIIKLLVSNKYLNKNIFMAVILSSS